MTDVDPEDVTAMRKQGDLRAFLRGQIAEGAARRDAKPKTAAPRPPGRRPGEWPPGTSPPGPFRCDCADCQDLARHMEELRDR